MYLNITVGSSLSGLALTRLASVTIAHAAILTLPTTPVQLVAAPGAGFLIWPQYTMLSSHIVSNYTKFGGSDVRFNVGWSDGAGGVTPIAYCADASAKLLAPTATKTVAYIPPPTNISEIDALFANGLSYNATTLMQNKALLFNADNHSGGDFTGGNAANTLSIPLHYVIVAIG